MDHPLPAGAEVNVCFLPVVATPEHAAALALLKSDIDDFEVHGREVCWRCLTRQSDSNSPTPCWNAGSSSGPPCAAPACCRGWWACCEGAPSPCADCVAGAQGAALRANYSERPSNCLTGSAANSTSSRQRALTITMGLPERAPSAKACTPHRGQKRCWMVWPPKV